jgi:4-hydroxybenzoate polyprenyltransferase
VLDTLVVIFTNLNLSPVRRARGWELKVVLRGYLELLRPANVVTAVADVLAGYAVAGLSNPPALPWLIGATACLYAGGVVLNDFFDRHLDAVERPERPLPSGRVGPGAAAGLGGGLLIAGIALASRATPAAGVVAAATAGAVLLYDTWGKRHGVVGPANMGLCRALNLLLGIAAAPAVLATHWPLGLIPFVYIAAVTLVSRGEVHGGKRGAAALALISLGGVILALAALSTGAAAGWRAAALAVTLLLAWRVIPPFWRVFRDPAPAGIQRAVRAGVLSLVLVDATVGAAYAGPLYGAVVLATAVVAAGLARLFAVT